MSSPQRYRIGVHGSLRPEWSDWLDGMAISWEVNGDTILAGPVADQAALHGPLIKIRDLGLQLVSVERINPDPEGEAASQDLSA